MTLSFRKSMALALSFVAALLLSATLLPVQQAHAATVPYPVYVGGVQVTSQNRTDVLGDGTVSFQISGSTEVPNKLTLSGANIGAADIDVDGATYEACGIYLGAGANTTIVLEGDNVIGVDGQGACNGIVSVDFLNIRGGNDWDENKLRINLGNGNPSEIVYGIRCERNFQLSASEVTIWGGDAGENRMVGVSTNAKDTVSQISGTLIISGTTIGIARLGQLYTPKVQVNPDARLKVECTSDYCFFNIGLNVNGGTVHAPRNKGSVFDSSAELKLNNGTIGLASLYGEGYVPTYYNADQRTQYKWLMAGSASVAPLMIGQTPVTSLNNDDILNCGGCGGYVNYDFNYQGQALGAGTLYIRNMNFANVTNADEGPYISIDTYRVAIGDNGPIDTGIYIGESTNVVLEGYNALYASASNVGEVSGLYVAPNAKVTIGSGGKDGLLLASGELFNGGASYGICCMGSLTVKDDAYVWAVGEYGKETTTGVFCDGALVVRDNATLAADGQCDSTNTLSSSNAFGVNVKGSIYVTDSAKLMGYGYAANWHSVGINYVGEGTVVFDGALAIGVSTKYEDDPSTGCSGFAAGIYVDCQVEDGPTTAVITKGIVIADATSMNGVGFGVAPVCGKDYNPSIRYGSSAENWTMTTKTSITDTQYYSAYVQLDEKSYVSSYLPAQKMWLVEYPGIVNYSEIPTYCGQIMFYDPVRHGWFTLIQGNEPQPSSSDFSTTSGGKIVLAKPDVFGTSEYGYRDMEGDLNFNNKVNIVDAQIAYDFTTGKLVTDFNTIGKKRLLMADVNSDGVLDAADALSIAHAALKGGYSKG